ncbi:MAG: type IV pilus biogenesis/stability protein PilW [Nitrosomonadales bacterium]|nr:MAG: type IV pilus biogenesis/stability protein PilW [Nitrosomonadales bacterium]
MKKWPLSLLLLLLAGCAGQSSRQPESYTSGSGSNDSAVRHRARIHTELGSGYYVQGMFGVALDELTQAAQIDPSFSPAHNGLGLVYSALREDALAEASFKRSVQLDPGSSETHNNYGTFLCSRNRVDESIPEFMAAVKNPLYSTPELAYLNAGVCALKKQDEIHAETYLLNALQLQPGLSKASYHLANIYFGRGDAAKAGDYLKRALEGTEASPEALWLGIRIARRLGDQNAEASYSLLLKNKFPASEQAKMLVSGQ